MSDSGRRREVRDVAIQLAQGRSETSDGWGRGVFLIGAGCSASAGVPLGRAVAEMCVVKAARRLPRAAHHENIDDPIDDALGPEDALQLLIRQKYLRPDTNWGNAYGRVFGELVADPTLQKEAIADAIARGQGKINWTHLVLGHLVAMRYVSTVLTTNFDQLVLQGMIASGVLPVVADGAEALSRIDPRPNTPQVVHLHGSLHTYQMRNAQEDVSETASDPRVITALSGLLRASCPLVVVGYAGGEEGVMRVLKNAVAHLGKKQVFWVLREGDESALSRNARELLESARLGGVIVGQDSDCFFMELLKELKVGAPTWLRNPIELLQLQQRQVCSEADDKNIRGALHYYERLLAHLAGAVEDFRARAAVEDVMLEARDLRFRKEEAQALVTLEGLARSHDDSAVWAEIGDLRVHLGMNGHPELLDSALEAYDCALRFGQQAPLGERASIHLERGRAHKVIETHGNRVIGERKQHLDLAIEAFGEALKLLKDERTGLYASVQLEMGNAIAHRAMYDRGLHQLDQGVEHLIAVLRGTEGGEARHALARSYLGDVKTYLEEHHPTAQLLETMREALQVGAS